MRAAVIVLASLLCACAAPHAASGVTATERTQPHLSVATALIDAFYSFNPSRLRAAMADAPASVPDIGYYQGWAEAGHYVVLNRKPCRLDKIDEVSCGIPFGTTSRQRSASNTM